MPHLQTSISSRTNVAQGLGTHRLGTRTGLQVLSAMALSLAGLVSGCQQTPSPIAETTPPPDVINTAEVYSPNELTISAPKNTLQGNSTLIQVAENSTDVIQVRAQDAPGSKLIYRLQDGEDMDKFLMDENSGDLKFINVPDWENPGDANQDNNYMVLWQVVSSSGGAQSQFMIVKVTDMPDE